MGQSITIGLLEGSGQEGQGGGSSDDFYVVCGVEAHSTVLSSLTPTLFIFFLKLLENIA